MSAFTLTRRGLFLGATGAALAGCDALVSKPSTREALRAGEWATYRWQRLIGGRHALAREFSAADISPVFKMNGTLMPQGEVYAQHVAEGFANWRLRVDGMVQRPLALSLGDLRRLPQRTQITRHDCVEGWSAIGGWTGVPLGHLLDRAGLLPNARYIVFHCADNLGGEPDKGGVQGAGRYYESVDLVDAYHPQTIMAHTMNGRTLPVGHGAPLRLRLERQLGYKHAKYVMRVEATDRLDRFGGGRGGYWEDRGYEWYAGI